MKRTAVNVCMTSATVDNMSRHDILEWVNDCLMAQYGKLEQLFDGSAYCNFMDMLFPGAIQMKKVKWNSKHEVDHLNNWKMLETTFKNLSVDKIVPVERLIKAKFQDNLEFLQWFKKFFDANYDGRDYNAMEARNGEVIPIDGPGKGMKRIQRSNVPSQTTLSTASSRSTSTKQLSSRSGGSVGKKSSSSISNTSNPPSRSSARAPVPSKPSSSSTGTTNKPTSSASEIKQLKEMMTEKTEQVVSLENAVEALEKERDFYFSKLRDIEVQCQDVGEVERIDTQKILEILYATEDGFAQPEGEDGDGNAAEEY